MLTDITKIEAYLLITIDEEFYPQVEEWIAAVTAYIERYTGRTFTYDPEAEATPKTYDGNDTNQLFIDDAVEITEVKINDTVLDETDYHLYPSNRLPKTRIILPYRNFTSGFQNVTVTAKWGYGEAVPADLSFAATVLVAGIINSADTNDNQVESETIGRYSVTYAKNSPQEHAFKDALKTLKLYRRLG
jgi:hypothetical protein